MIFHSHACHLIRHVMLRGLPLMLVGEQIMALPRADRIENLAQQSAPVAAGRFQTLNGCRVSELFDWSDDDSVDDAASVTSNGIGDGIVDMTLNYEVLGIVSDDDLTGHKEWPRRPMSSGATLREQLSIPVPVAEPRCATCVFITSPIHLHQPAASSQCRM
ncbi:MAG: hypothetical protein LKF49_03730 [Bifidobacterium tibiigranuli]|jgi:hypothetical protein|uniref:hypothetical protein n=1 Tax=Bifidobacterium tibiigranuli TaxID=2172043 RepID=UPI0023521C83|nr:hypothetical protein [Bifidobacterium tibiigranuli]MCH3974223.1 hypothetical protein [Bifidobacterium tibiigranuli]MCH4188786.1 hypothetical protein [Bifidobacterium tibiigranuli]MCH4203309.1 hypothetical protein [Bifidobacterium tibiigranuli]MCH4273542.1 hypothetical protein [Bifidobacterium tibiigranuli]MCI1790656.1 hypothetical protein [Bifidobacterium tibiigranuli]